LNRRELVAALGLLACSARTSVAHARKVAAPPGTAVDWRPLAARLGERLVPVTSPLAACAAANGAGADELFARIRNPYYLGDEPGLTQTLGWIDAWTSQPSAMAVVAESAADVAAAVDFARRSGVRLVVKGGGHNYFGNSNAAGSLLIWTRRLDAIEMHDDFRPAGMPASERGIPAVSVGAGAIWGPVYRHVTRRGRYVQGGGCLTVGVAGFVQGGGFGSLSKSFGTGAANLVEAEVVTPDGRIRVVNRWRDPELYFALRGGGGGTFGVVTRVTMKTHALPSHIGGMLFEVRASDDAAWRELVERMLRFYSDALFEPRWGEQIRFSPGRRLAVQMVCHGLDEAAMRAAWAPFLDSLRREPSRFVFKAEPVAIAVPASQFWEPEWLRKLPGLVLPDDRPGASQDNVFWASNLSETGQVLNAYRSAWLPASLLAPARRDGLVDALVAGSAEWSMSLHMNKGLAGGAPEAIAATRETAMNPAVLDAFALLICAADAPPAWPGIRGHEPDVAEGRAQAVRVGRAMQPIARLVPDAGSYVSESDYFETDWKRSHWGANYARLAAAKRRYDPATLLRGHHCVERS
jgi:FAD/FMN-containing dehydrogenase